MYTTVDLRIIPDQPTSKGNVWTKAVCEKVVSQINSRAPMKCYFMDSSLKTIGKPAATIVGAEIDGSIKIYVETTQNPEGKLLSEMIDSAQYMPVIEPGEGQPVIVEGTTTIAEIKKLVGIGVNANPIIRAHLESN